MAWFSHLAGKAENLLNNLDEQTGAAIRKQNLLKQRRLNNNNSDQPTRGPEKSPRVPIVSSRFHPSTQKTRTSPESSRYQSPVRQRKPLYPEPPVVRQRRASVPTDLRTYTSLAVSQLNNVCKENDRLKIVIENMKEELCSLIEKNDTIEYELNDYKERYQETALQKAKLDVEKQALADQLREMENEMQEIEGKFEDDTDLLAQKDLVAELTAKEKLLEEIIANKETANLRLENELRHINTIVVVELQNNLDESRKECAQIIQDWEAYKVRVKNMLSAKDEKIKCLRDSGTTAEDSKTLMEEIELLKEERDTLSMSLSTVQSEYEALKKHMDIQKNHLSSAERTIAALRDTLKEEREFKSKMECRIVALSKELKILEMESSSEIAALRKALRAKEDDIRQMMEVSRTESNVINVADFDSYQSLDNNKVQQLTEKLVQKQGNIDALLAENNMLKIQLSKTESKLKQELSQQRVDNSYSVINFQDHRTTVKKPRSTAHLDESIFSKLSKLVGVFMMRYPVFRVFILLYMACLHFWVFTVLFTSTNDVYVRKRAS